jgi:hypothetical protein
MLPAFSTMSAISFAEIPSLKFELTDAADRADDSSMA